MQVINCMLLCSLIGLVVYDHNSLVTLEAQLPMVQSEIDNLQTEVTTKQQVQIQELHDEVQEEHNLTFLTLAGIFTLLTCLISMFHMSSHLQKMVQPTIQRKIVAILWMSPIYSVTSFLSLLYPPLEGYCAIVKDFYESYCIYTFLSFLIAVLGRGDRDQAVQVLSRYANHLHRPTRFLSWFYDSPPEASDQAKASAVITECQILAMQFVFIRPLTTVVYVIYTSLRDSGDSDSGDTIGNTTGSSDDIYYAAGGTGTGTGTDAPMEDYNGTRLRWLEGGGGDWEDLVDEAATNETASSIFTTLAPTVAPMVQSILESLAPSAATPINAFSTYAPVANNTVIPTYEEGVLATEAYFKSFSFVLTMIVNISVFFAFTGLLKFYHAVHEELKWCRPWPKFVTIKGVVFLTFWQGLVILIVVNLGSNGDDDPSAQAKRYQNILICLEMLFFSITHWCVFPAEEWEKDYQPPQVVHKAGIGIQDFVSDVGYIVKSGREGRKTRRRRKTRDHGGLYARPATASMVTSTSTLSEEGEDVEISQQGVVLVDETAGYNNTIGTTRRVVPSRARVLSEGSSVKADDELDDWDTEML
jgi:hypothetical protein